MINKIINLRGDNEDVSLTTYVLSDSKEMLNGAKRPAILICPGGAYLSCSDRESEPVAMRFASMGYHAFVLRYSVYQNTVDNIFEMGSSLPVREKSLYPNAMLDIASALACIHEHSEEWLVDTEKIVLCGFSAGAHNASMYATGWNKNEDIRKFDGIRLKPIAVILGYTLSDYEYLSRNKPENAFDSKLFEASNLSVFGTMDVPEDMISKFSPCYNVDAETPPMFLWATSEDTLVPAHHSLVMAKSLAENGIPYELHIFEEGQHGLCLANQASAHVTSQVLPRVASWIELAESWISKRIKLTLSEKGWFE